MFLITDGLRAKRREVMNSGAGENVFARNFLAAIVSCTVLLSGCALMDASTAMGEGKEAEEAVLRLDDQRAIEEVSLQGKNIKARVAAIGKLNNVSRLEWFISDDQPAELSIAAFQRIVALNKAEEMLREDSSLRHIVVMGGEKRKERLSFPEEWRIKAMQINDDCFGSDDTNIDFLLDQSVPMSVRKAAIGKIRLDKKGLVRLLNAAADTSNSGRNDYQAMAKGFCASQYCFDYDESILGNRQGDTGVSLGARQLLFTFPRNEKERHEALENILWGAMDDEEAGKKDSENMKFFKWAIANTKDAKVLGEFIRYPGTLPHKVPQYLEEAAKYLDDDDVIVDILTNSESLRKESKLARVAMMLASKIKDPQKKTSIGATIMASNAPDAKTRAEAMVAIYSTDPEHAYKIVKDWFSTEHYEGNVAGDKIVDAVRDVNTLLGLTQMCQKDPANLSSGFRQKIIRSLKKSVLNRQTELVDSLPKEKLEKLVTALSVRSKKLSQDGTACVVGGYYVGMPLMGLIALNKTQGVEARPIDWKLDQEGKHIVVTRFSFDIKNIYKATGLERTQIVAQLPEKLGVPRFMVNATAVKLERNLIAEAFGDYSGAKITGGDFYLYTESQAKGVRLTFWEESGVLVVSSL